MCGLSTAAGDRRGAALVDPLNRLIIRAHGQIYRGSAASPWGLGRFFLRDYPRLFRRTWKFTFASLLVSLAAAFAGYWTVQDNPRIVADIMGGNDREFYGNKTIADIRERFGHESNPLMSSVIISNNVRVALAGVRPGHHVRRRHGRRAGAQRRDGRRHYRGVCQKRASVENVDGAIASRCAGTERHRHCRRRRAIGRLRPFGRPASGRAAAPSAKTP